MSDRPTPDQDREFFAEFRRWGERPATTDARAAARRVVAALPEPRAPFRLRLLAVSTVALLAAFLAVWQAGWRPQPGAASAASMEPLPENVVLWYIEPETPVYFVLPPSAERGESS